MFESKELVAQDERAHAHEDDPRDDLDEPVMAPKSPEATHAGAPGPARAGPPEKK